MRVITCDRCGKKLFKETKCGHLFGEYYAPRGFYGNAWFKRWFDHRNIDVDLDLCEDCAKELATWLHIDNNNSRSA